MLRFFLAIFVIQACVGNGVFDYFAAINGCLEGTLPEIGQDRDKYDECMETIFEDPFCKMFCLLHRATYRISCDQFDESEKRSCYMYPNPLEYVYGLWTGTWNYGDYRALAPDSVLQKFKLETGTTVREAQNAIFAGVEKSVSGCLNGRNLTITTHEDYIECQDLSPEDRAVVEKYIDCLETAWKTCGDTI